MGWHAVSSDDAKSVKTVQWPYTEIMWLSKYRVSVKVFSHRIIQTIYNLVANILQFLQVLSDMKH